MADEEDATSRRRRARDDRDLRADADGAAALGLEPREPRARRRRAPRRGAGAARSSRRSRASRCAAAARSCSTPARRSTPARSCATGPAARARRSACRSASWAARSACCTRPARSGEPLAAEQVAQLTTLATQAGARIGTVRAFEKTQLQASTDGLTGLVNRRTLETQLRGLVKQRRAVRARDRRPRPLQAAERHARARGRRPRAAPVRAGRRRTSLRDDDVDRPLGRRGVRDRRCPSSTATRPPPCSSASASARRGPLRRPSRASPPASG